MPYHAPTNLSVDGPVENNQSRERNQIHDEEVGPVDVDVDVGGVLPERTHEVLIDGRIEVEVESLRARADLEPSGYVVEDGPGKDDHDAVASPPPGAEGAGPERVTDGHVALDRHGQRDVDAARLGRNTDGVEVGDEDGVEDVAVGFEGAREVRHGRESEDESGYGNEKRVTEGEGEEEAGHGGLHLGPGEDHGTERVSHDPEAGDDDDPETLNDKVKSDGEVLRWGEGRVHDNKFPAAETLRIDACGVHGGRLPEAVDVGA